MSLTDRDQRLHVAVVGAGPVGLALALLMARRCPQWRVSLFDARALEADIRHDPRTLALSLGSVQLLRQLGAWPLEGTQPILRVQVSQESPAMALAGSRPEVNIRALELGVPELGAVLAHGTLVPALQRAWQAEQALAPDRLHHRFGQAVRGLKVVASLGPNGGPARRVEVDAGVAEAFDLAVVAEGGVFMRDAHRSEVDIDETITPSAGEPVGPVPDHSPLGAFQQWRRRWDTREIRHDYRQTAWVGTVGLSGAEPGFAVERFTRQGPVALLPLPPAVGTEGPALSRASLVWCVDSDPDPVARLNDAQRMAVLNALLPPQAGRIEHIGPLKSFPLGLLAQTSLVRGGCLVRIGNAAQTLHPVAGQGLNLGLRDAHALVERLRNAQRRGESVAQALAHVDWARAADRWSMIAATDFLARSFTWALPGAATARALGLLAVEHLPGLKPALARQMMFGRR